MTRCPRCGRIAAANADLCACGEPLVDPDPEDAISDEELERLALSTPLPEGETAGRNREASEKRASVALPGTVLGVVLAYQEGDALLKHVDGPMMFVVLALQAVAAFSLQGFLRRFSGMASELLRVVAFAGWLAAIAAGAMIYAFLVLMSGLGGP